jgi:hypothetical protein
LPRISRQLPPRGGCMVPPVCMLRIHTGPFELSARSNANTSHSSGSAFTAFLAAGRAPGIAAESPQEAHRRFRGLGAESPAPVRSTGEAPNVPWGIISLRLFVFCGILYVNPAGGNRFMRRYERPKIVGGGPS